MTDQSRKPLNLLSQDTPLATWDLRALVRQLKSGEAWRTSDRQTMPLFRTEQMRVLLIALRAGAALSSHRADGPITVQVIEGRIIFSTESQVVTLTEGQVLSLQAGLPHAVEAAEESVFLLTVVPDRMAAHGV